MRIKRTFRIAIILPVLNLWLCVYSELLLGKMYVKIMVKNQLFLLFSSRDILWAFLLWNKLHSNKTCAYHLIWNLKCPEICCFKLRNIRILKGKIVMYPYFKVYIALQTIQPCYFYYLKSHVLYKYIEIWCNLV